MSADPQDLPPLAEVLRELRESALRQIDDLPNYKTGVELLRSRTWLRAYAKACLDLIQRTVAPYDAERQRLREALAAKDRAFCTAPLRGLKPEFFAFCEIAGESPEIQFFESAEEASKAADEYLERAEELLADGLIEEPEIAYGRIYARCETSKGPAPDDADYDETWSFELEPRLTAEAENERLRARVAELEARLEPPSLYTSQIGYGEPSAHCSCCEAELDEPHSWKECAELSAAAAKSATDAEYEAKGKIMELEARLAPFEEMAAAAQGILDLVPDADAPWVGMARKLAARAPKETT